MHTSDAFFGWSRSIRRDGHSVGYTRISLRTVPRNFPGRSGTEEDQVYLCSPETATASALTGKITDPRTLAMAYPNFQEPKTIRLNTAMLAAPAESGEAVALEKGPNIVSLPLFEPLPDTLEGPVLLKVEDDISTDEIMPAGSRILPYRSNIPKISEFSFSRIDATYSKRAKQHAVSFVVGGDNYGQGSSREHAALGPRYLGLRAVLAKSYARIHQQNLINFGILPLTFSEPNDWERIAQNDVIAISGMRKALAKGKALPLVNKTKNESYDMEHMLTERSLEMILAGGLINVVRGKQGVE